MNPAPIQTSRGLTIVRPDLLRERITGEHTIIACGASRGGTTALAYALARGGVDLGPDLPLNLEDDRFVACLHYRTLDQVRLVKLLNEPRTGRWGFKVPDAVFHLPWLDDQAVNPVFTIILRSPLSTANSVITHDPNFPEDSSGLENALRHPLTYYAAVTDALQRIEAPVVLVDYENLHFRSLDTLRRLYVALGLEPPDIVDIAAELAENGYKRL